MGIIMRDDKKDIIYEHLTEIQLNSLEGADDDTKHEVIDLIDDLHNQGVKIETSIKIAFQAFML